MKITSFLKKYILKYFSAILIVGFVVSYLFIIDNNYIDICNNDKKIRSLQQSIEQEKISIDRLKQEIYNVKTDPATIERIAREKYGMQRAHEDVYLVTSDTVSSSKTNRQTHNPTIQ